jgi:hypothetical protein
MSNIIRSIAFVMAVTLIYSCKTARISKRRTSPIPDTTQVAKIDSLPVTVIEEAIEVDTVAMVDSTEIVPQIDTFSIIGVGDIMMGTNFPKAAYLPPRGTNLLDSVKTYSQKC